MYNWKIEIILKSGKDVTVYYKGSENNSTAVANKVLVGASNTLNGFSNEDNTKNIFVNISEIAVASISAA